MTDFKIKDLDHLRQTLQEIHEGRSPIKIKGNTLKLLSKMADEPNVVALNSISELGRIYATNPSTLSRLSKKLQFGGFPEFQSIFKAHLVDKDNFYSERLEIINQSNPDDRYHQIFNEMILSESNNMSRLIHNLPEAAIDNFCNSIRDAGTVYVYGARMFYSISSFFAYALRLIRNDVDFLNPANQGAALTLSQADYERDVIVLFGCHPHTPETVKISQVAHQLGIKVLAFTDSHSSPLALNSSHYITLLTDGPFYSNNVASWVMFMESFLTIYAKYFAKDAKEILKNRELVFSKFY